MMSNPAGIEPGAHEAGNPASNEATIAEATIAEGIQVIPVRGLPEVRPGDEIADLIANNARLQDGDVVVVTQKIVSKAEGRLVKLPEPAGGEQLEEPSILELVLQESVRVLRRRGELLLTETKHGFVCANAGIDRSNMEPGEVALLPVDPDRSARHIRDRLRALFSLEVGVVISDTFGRTWRRGLVDVAIGCAGIAPLLDLRGSQDSQGRVLKVTEICIADEIAAAAELVMGKSSATAAVVLRGLERSWLREGSVRHEIVRPYDEDLFR
jgi:coenzyme F420-0:L-glutamate ligase/coenzyme F420-1:gamma-L-glutamate ligase